MNTPALSPQLRSLAFREIHEKSDRIMKYVMWLFFIFGGFLAFFYDTFIFAFSVGGISVATYFITRIMFPEYSLYRYVMAAVLGVFTAQFIYQMHGLFEMHFFFFVASALLITYQNWKLQLPLFIFILLHHSLFAYLQYAGMPGIYFSQLEYMDLQSFLFHAGIAGIIIFICGYWAYDLEQRTIREFQSKNILEQQLLNVKNNIAFAEQISSGNLTLDYTVASGDELGTALQNMKNNLLSSTAREQGDKYITAGMATIGEILRRHTNDIKGLSDELTPVIVKYLHANQGALFLLEHDAESEEAFLQLTACYAYDRKKFMEKRVAVGQGLVGQCFLEREIIFMTDVPNDYVNITSGLGTANPRSIVMIPLVSNDEVQGVIELASFGKFTEVELMFMQKASESIASTIISTRTTEKIKLLLEESQQRSEELLSQEEEMRQNMEELNAVQEQLNRQLTETEKVKYALEVRENVFGVTTILSESDIYGTITYVNDKFCDVAKYSRHELMGKSHNIVRHPDMPKVLFQQMWTAIKAGKVFRGIVKNRAKDGSAYWVDATIVPIHNKDGQITKYIGARYHIRDVEVAEKLYAQQLATLGIENTSLVQS